MKLKLKLSMKILAMVKKCLTLVIIQLNQNIMITQTKQVVDKIKDEAAGVLIEEFVGFGIWYTVIVSIKRETT